MVLNGTHEIPAAREKVWRALNDPEVLKACIKGCQRLIKVRDCVLEGSVQAKVGPVKATFDGTVEFVDPAPPHSVRLVGEGRGGVAGFAHGVADIVLAEVSGGTRLTYHARASVGGKLAQVGARLLDATARKNTVDFLEALSAHCAAMSPGDVAAREVGQPGRKRALANMDVVDTAAETGAVMDDRADGFADAGPAPCGTQRRTTGVKRGLLWGIFAFAVVFLVLIALD